MAASFIDKARIFCRAGKGGNGAVAFHREKYVSAGGPDGGDGGNGGNIVLVVDDNMSTLMDFRYKRKYTAENGMDGQGARKFGKQGKDLTIRVPRGTVVRAAESNEIIKDMSDSEPFILCRGGKGGWGNAHFATPTRQAPRFAKSGLEGEEHDVVLELKLLADVGLIGFPNVGKSTLLSVVSKARPKIANYHFTTLYPNLGVVYVDEGVSFVMADIPGIIEGAADGAGLGHDFLRHIDRCRLLVHVVDVSGSEGRDPVEDFDAINAELSQYSPDLATRPQIVVANKTDIMEDESLLEKLRAHVEPLGYPLFALSAASHTGTRELVLVGIDLAAYRDADIDLARLVTLLQEKTDIGRVRVSSVEPQSVTPTLVDVLAHSEGRLCRHLHLCLQSGSDKVLREMNRRYDADAFCALANRLHEAVPRIALSTDVIVGFPGETEGQFQETLDAVRAVNFMSSFSFCYSDRPGTAASRHTDKVEPAEKLRRLERLQALQEELSAEWLKARVGCETDILLEGISRKQDGEDADRESWQGRDPWGDAVNVSLPAGTGKPGLIVPVAIVTAKKHSLVGKAKG